MKRLSKTVALLVVAALILAIAPNFAPSVIHAAEQAGTAPVTHLTAVPEGYTGIYTKADLDNVRNDLAGNYILMNDIVFTAADFAEGGDFYNNGSGWNSINFFSGTFDGNGYAIKNLHINIKSNSNVNTGLFGYNKGVVKNLGMVDGSVSATSSLSAYVGGIAGIVSSEGTITNCYNTGSVKAVAAVNEAYAGAIAGRNEGTISNCYNTGSVFASVAVTSTGIKSFAGGIAGRNTGAVKACYNSGSVRAEADSVMTCSGGIVGNDSGTITDCYNTGSVSASVSSETSSFDVFAGGVAGVNYDANGDDETGSGEVTNCYNVGSVSVVSASTVAGADALFGGISGFNSSGTITNCYYPDTFSQGAGDGADTATKCTAEEMKLQSTFAGFDFNTTWTMQGDGLYLYPELQDVPRETVPKSGADLSVNYTDYVPAATVYSLDVEWDDDLSFDYVAGAQGDWNVEEHAYDNAVEGKWEDDDVNVVITNHSNAAVEASVSIVNHSDKVTVTANQDSATLNSAVGTAKDAAPSFTFVLTVTGEPTEAITKAATATVSFASATGPVPVSPSNLKNGTYSCIRPDIEYNPCNEAIQERSITFDLAASTATSAWTVYKCQEHCECESASVAGHLQYNGQFYCLAIGDGITDLFQISNNYIIVGASTYELLSDGTLRNTETGAIYSYVEPVPVSPSNLKNGTYSYIKPNYVQYGSCNEAIEVVSITFNLADSTAGVSVTTYSCQEHCVCESTSVAGHHVIPYNGIFYCMASGFGDAGLFEISDNYIIVGSSPYELRSDGTLRDVESGTIYSYVAPGPVSPSNLTDRVYTLIKPDPDNPLGVCDKTLYVRELSFGANGRDEEFTYVCQEHCPCPSTEDPEHACLSYGGELYCMVYGAGAENIYEITGNLINEGSFSLELLSNDTLCVVSVRASGSSIISSGDIFS